MISTIVGIIGVLAALGLPLAWLAQAMSDNPYDDSGRRLGNVLLAVALCSLLILLALS